MSVQWLSWVFEHSATKGAKRLVLLSLANHADDKGVCWPSMTTIAREAGLSRRRAEDGIRALVSDGLVERSINAAPAVGHAGYRPNLYHLVRSEPRTEQAPLNRPPRDNSGPPNTSGPDGTGPPESSALGVDDFDEQAPPKRRTEPSVEPSVEPSALSRPTTLVDVSASPSATELATERFEEHFWLVYPKRHGRRVGKAKALKLWLKLPVAQQRRAALGAKAYASACETTNSYAKDAERWLRDRCWDEWLALADDAPTTAGIGSAAALPNGGALTIVPNTPAEWEAMGYVNGASSA